MAAKHLGALVPRSHLAPGARDEQDVYRIDRFAAHLTAFVQRNHVSTNLAHDVGDAFGDMPRDATAGDPVVIKLDSPNVTVTDEVRDL